MAIWSRRERSINYVEYTVPAGVLGAPWGQVSLALDAALDDVRREEGHDSLWEPSDDRIRILPMDDEIVIRFEKQPRSAGEEM
jgi:hypothetical protein